MASHADQHCSPQGAGGPGAALRGLRAGVVLHPASACSVSLRWDFHVQQALEDGGHPPRRKALQHSLRPPGKKECSSSLAIWTPDCNIKACPNYQPAGPLADFRLVSQLPEPVP